MYKLPVFETIRDTYRFIGGQLSALVNYAMVPVIFGALFITLITFTSVTRAGGQINLFGADLDPDQIATLPQLSNLLPTSALFVLGITIVVTSLAFYILFTVAWHRRYLLGPSATSPREIFAWRGRHWRFLGNGILVAIILLLAAIPIMLPFFFMLELLTQSMNIDPTNPMALVAPAIVLNIFVSVPIALIACRLVTVFPAIAIDQTEFRIRSSIALTRRNTWRIALIFFLGLYLPYTIISWGFSLLLITPFVLKLWIGSIGLGFIAMLLQQIVVYGGIAIGVSTLSIIYKQLTDNIPAAGQSAGSSAT